MAEKYLEIINDNNNVLLDALTKRIVLIKKGGAAPSGSNYLFTADGQSTSFHFGYASGSGSDFGMKVWDASGDLIFDAISFSKLAKPVDTISCNLGMSGTNKTESKTLPSGRTYAVYVHQPMSAFVIRNVAVKVGSQYTYFYAMDQLETTSQVSGTTVSLTCRKYPDSGTHGAGSGVPYTTSGWTRASAMIFDVTNF